MAKNPVLEARTRERGGKGAARAVRRQGLVPAVIYGDKKDPVVVSFDYQELMKHVRTGRFMSTLVDINVDGGENIRAIARDLQFEPVRDFLQHVDFLRLGKGARITVEVSCNFINEDDCPGISRGGVMNVVRYEIEMDCLATNIPEEIEIDLAGLDIGDGVHASDLKLPEGAELVIDDRDFTIITIVAPASEEEPEDEDEDEIDAADVPTVGDDEAGDDAEGDDE